MGAATVDSPVPASGGVWKHQLRTERTSWPLLVHRIIMNGNSSPVFEGKKPSLPIMAGSSISASKDSPTLPESSSTDMDFYSGQSALYGAQDFYPSQQQTYPAQHVNPYAYHHHYVHGGAAGGAYPVGKAEYSYLHSAYREHGAFSRDAQAALHDGEFKTTTTTTRC